MSELKEPKTRRERIKDQDTKVKFNGKYTAKHVRITMDKTTQPKHTQKIPKKE